MVFIAPPVETWQQSFGKSFGQGLGEGVNRALDIRQRNKLIQQLKGGGNQPQSAALMGGEAPGTPEAMFAQEMTQNQPKSKAMMDSALAAYATGEKDLGDYFSQEAKAEAKLESEERESTRKRTEPILEETRKVRASLPGKKTALNLFKNAIDEGIGPISIANLGDKFNQMTGTNLFPENASAKEAAYASKTYLVENLGKVGAKGLNQFLEKQIIQAQPSIGATEKGNRAVLHAMESAYDIEKNYADNVGKIQDMYEDAGRPVPKTAIRQAEKISQSYAEERMKKLAVDLQENQEKALSDKEVMGINRKGEFKKVIPGTPLTQRNARLFSIRFGDKAEAKAKSLGYETEYPVLPEPKE